MMERLEECLKNKDQWGVFREVVKLLSETPEYNLFKVSDEELIIMSDLLMFVFHKILSKNTKLKFSIVKNEDKYLTVKIGFNEMKTPKDT